MTSRTPRWIPVIAVVAAAWLVLSCGGSKEEAPAAGAPATKAQAEGSGAGSPAPAGGEGAGAEAPPSALPSPAPVAIPPPIPDTVVAEVNGTPIRARKLLGLIEANRARQRALGRPLTPEAEAAMREAALEALIAEQLLLQAADGLGVKATPEEVEQQLASIREGFPTEEAFKSYLAQVEMTETALREEAARRVTVSGVVRVLAGDVKVTEADAKQFYDQNVELFREGDKVRASIIVVKTGPTDPEPIKADARKRIDEARKRAAAGEDFAALAKQYSQVPNAAEGGDLGFFGKNEGLFPRIEEIAFATEIGQVSPVFDTPTGLNVMKVFERRPSRVRPFDDVKGALLARLGELQEGQIVEGKIGELRSKATIKIVDRTLLEAPREADAAPPEPKDKPAAGTDPAD